MTGLFTTLAGRFQPDAVPQITPRAQVRFAPVQDDEAGIEEQAIERIAPRPLPPERPQTSLDPSPTPPTASLPDPVAPIVSAQRPADAPPPPETVDTSPTSKNPVDIPDPTPRQTDHASEQPVISPVTQTETHEIATTRQTTATTPPDPVPMEDRPAPERIIQQPTTLVTRLAAPEPPAATTHDQHSGPRNAVPVAQAPLPSVTVKIGRIEVGKPAAAPPAPPRAPSPAQTQRTLARTQKSSLTNYLGWKN